MNSLFSVHIMTASVTAVQFKTQSSGGYIKLGSTPAGQITVDVYGENNAGSNNAAMLDFKSNILTGDAGIYIESDVTGSEVIDYFLDNVAAYWNSTRLGTL